MLSLGLPTNATAAVMLAAFTQYGIQPGPLLFEREPQLVWALIASLFIGNLLLLLINLPLAPAWAKLLQIPRPYLYAGIVFFATLGAYSVNLQAFDLGILLVLGLLGFMMRRYGLPILPLILGVILGPRLEEQLRTSLQLSDGHVSGLFSEPVAVVVYVDRRGGAGLAAGPPAAGRRTPAGPAEARRRPDRESGRRWRSDERRRGLRPDPGGRDRPRARASPRPARAAPGWWW